MVTIELRGNNMYALKTNYAKQELEDKLEQQKKSFPDMIICDTTVKAVLAQCVCLGIDATWNDGKEACYKDLIITKE